MVYFLISLILMAFIFIRPVSVLYSIQKEELDKLKNLIKENKRIGRF